MGHTECNNDCCAPLRVGTLALALTTDTVVVSVDTPRHANTPIVAYDVSSNNDDDGIKLTSYQSRVPMPMPRGDCTVVVTEVA